MIGRHHRSDTAQQARSAGTEDVRKRLEDVARPSRARALISVAVCVALLSTGLVLSACDKAQKLDPTSDSVILEATRLAGYPAAQVGMDRARAVLSLTLPSVTSAADIELAWQTGMAILTEAYPTSPLYRVVIGTSDRALLSAEAVGNAVVQTVEEDDPKALRKITTFTLLADVSDRGELLPEESVSTTGQAAALDAANRAAGLETTTGPALTDAGALKAAWKLAYKHTHGVPAPSGGAAEAAKFASARIEAALKRRSIDGERALDKLVPKLMAARDVDALRQWAATTEAVASDVPIASVLELTAAATRAVRTTSVDVGPETGPIASLQRLTSRDVTVTASVAATGFVGQTLLQYGVRQSGRQGLAYHPAGQSGSETVVAPEVWLAYAGRGGALYWLAGPGGSVGLTDTTLRGWGYEIPSASLVDAADVSRVVAVYTRASE